MGATVTERLGLVVTAAAFLFLGLVVVGVL